jgi:hypothetical protein
MIAHRLDYISVRAQTSALSQTAEVGRLANALANSLRRKLS